MASVLYCVNSTAQSVLADGIINLGSIIRKTCNSQANLNGNAINIYGTGYYTVDVSATFSSSTIGNVGVALYKDGVSVVGANGTETISTATTETRTISFTCEIKNSCCENISSLTLVNDGIAATFTNISIRVKRDA